MLAAFGPLAIDMYLPAFPAIARDLQASTAAVGLTLAVYFVGLAVGQVLIGPISDRVGRVRPVRIGLVVFAIASLLAAAAPRVEWLIAARVLQALGGAASAVAARAVVRDLYRGHEAARVQSQLVLVMGVAPILAPTVGGLLLQVAGWRAIFGLLCVAGLLALAVVWNALPETAPPTEPERRADTLRALLRDRCYVAYVLTSALMSGGMFAYITGAPFALIERHHVGATTFGWIFGGNAAGYILMSQVNVRLLRSRRPAQILKLGLALAMTAAVALLVQGALGVDRALTVELSLFGFIASLGIILPNATALALEEQGARAGSASAWQGALQFGTGALASAAVSALHDGTVVPMAAVMTTVAVGAVVTLTIARRLRLTSRSSPCGSPSTGDAR